MADRPGPEPSEPCPNRRARLGPVAPALGAVVTLAALAVLGWSAATTASARIAGSTESTGSLLQAASVSLQRDGSGGDRALAAELLVDTRGLYPGVVVERCLAVRYQGSLDGRVPLVLSARIPSGTGLDRYLDTAVSVGTGADPACADFTAGTGPAAEPWAGTLADLASAHPRYERGLALAGLVDGQAVTVRFRFEVQPDNQAQGRSTAVRLRFEVRP